jgi:phosphatidylglycerophosphate synthase
MRSADAATVFRALLAIVVVYLILIKVNPYLITLLVGIVIALDAVDGYFAVREVSKGSIGLLTYLKAAAGNRSASARVKKFKDKLAETSKHGARMDIAGDRVVEYSFWIVYTFVGVIPLFVLFLIVLRHSFVDAIMANKGTSSKMKTKLGQVVYSSVIGRGGINVVKFLTFSYLAFVYIAGYPVWIGYVLAGILVAYILLRGLAEIMENV